MSVSLKLLVPVMWVPELTQKPEAEELCVSEAQFPAKNFTIRKCRAQKAVAAEDTEHLEGHSKKCTQVLSSGEGHSQLTSWDPRPCTKTRQVSCQTDT